ncbi:MAG: hypothetical protein ACFFD4_05650 [Candidatus Odinarchaeota archaeon]
MSKKRSFKQLLNYIPSLIILFIAGCAFLASFVQSDYSAQVNLLQEEFTDKQVELERLAVEQQTILNEDTLTLLTGNEWMASALDAALLWKEKRNRAVLSPWENASLLAQIVNYFNLRIWIYRGSNIGTIEAYFSANPTAEEYVLANQTTKGFDFVISRTDWQAGGYGNPMSMNLTLMQYNFPGVIIPYILEHPDAPEIQVTMQIQRFNDYLQTFVIEQQTSLNELNTRIEQLESIIGQISNGVGLITVATILSTAMAERISSAEASTKLSTIRADILKDDSIIEKRGNKLSILILIGAALLSTGGLVIPILLVT